MIRKFLLGQTARAVRLNDPFILPVLCLWTSWDDATAN